MVTYICCAGGATSSLFCQNIMKHAKTLDKKIYLDDIFTVLNSEISILDNYDLVLCYGPAEKVITSFSQNPNFLKIVDCVIVCPQARYLTSLIQKALKPYNIPCSNIDMAVFGKMNGEKGLEILLDIIEKNKS